MTIEAATVVRDGAKSAIYACYDLLWHEITTATTTTTVLWPFVWDCPGEPVPE